MRIRLFSLSLFLLMVFINPVSAQSETGSVLKLGVQVSAVGKLDPHFAAASQDRLVADMIFNGLLRYQPGNAPKIEADLAKKIPEFTIIEGKQIWTVELREGVMFHQGPQTASYEMTADDVVYSLKKSQDKKYCAYSGSYADMTIKKIDTYTLQIILNNPISPILFFPKITSYGGGFIVSKKAIEAMGYEAYTQHPVGTGPFIFTPYKKGATLTLNANNSYFRGKPKLSGVQIHFIPDTDDRTTALKNGQVDIIIGSGKKGWLESIAKEKDLFIDPHGVGEVGTIHFNTKIKPLDDIKVRQAIAYALNRKTFLETTNQRIAGAVYSPVPQQFLPGGLTFKEARRLKLDYAQNINLAKQLLQDAGYPNGFTLDLVTSEKRIYRSYYAALKAQLEKINITCNIRVETHSNMHKEIRNNPKPIVIYAAWRPNADAYLTRFFHSDSIIVTGKKPDTNFSCYNKIDPIIEAARLETNPDKQLSLWIQAQISILSDMVAYPVMFTKSLYIRKNYVDYGHILVSTMALYPQFTEKTQVNGRE